MVLLSTLLALFLEVPAFSHAYSWRFQSPPQQCKNLTVQITGSGSPPYRILIIPSGPSPFSNNTEVRRIIDHPFGGSSNTVSFQLKYPANSQLVAVVSDSTGFGSGGTSVAAEVTSSDDSSCFDATKEVSPDFVFSIEPANQIVQCQATRIWWDPSTVQGTPQFQGLIPGGQSFQIPEGSITQVANQGTGFSWTPSIRGGTTLFLVGGDDRGNGTGGSSSNTVSSGINNDNSCLNSNSPSSTPGNPAGGTYPTSSTGASTGSNGSSNNVGPIVGGVIGGIVFLIAIGLVFLFYRRRRRFYRQQREKPVDLLHDDQPAENQPLARNELPQYYQPQPFIVPDPTVTSSDGQTEDGRTRSGTPDLLGGGMSSSSSTTRKGYQQKLRAVNIIQHDDAGPSINEEDEPETIELPPAYTKIRRQASREGDASTPAEQTSEAARQA